MTITVKKTVLVYVAVFLMTLLIGYLYLAQSNDIYKTEQTYEMTDHQIKIAKDKQPNNIDKEPNHLSDSNTLVGSIE
nr:DNA damage-induced cell division inhibitor SosA [Mammaliicoccus sp. Marseille-Q6498]